MIDHTPFIAKHHKGEKLHPDLSRPRPMHPFLIALFTVLYLGGCVAIAIYLKLDQTIIIVTVFVFIASFSGALLFKRVMYAFSRQEKERVILREVIEGSRAGRLVTDSADNTVYANMRFQDLCVNVGRPGLPTLKKFFEANDKASGLFSTLSEQAHKGLTDEIELVTTLDGQEKSLLITAQPVPGWAGYIHWRIDDVTRERELDRALDEEREKLIDFTDNAPVGFFSVNEEGRFLFVNATLARWLGEDIEDLLKRGRLHSYLVDPPFTASPYDLLARGGARQVAEIKMKGPAGRVFLASVNMAVVHEADGRVRTRGVVHDLTIEKAMRQALKASEDRFQRFFEEAPLGIALVDSTRAIKDGNEALAGMLGIDIAKLDGLDFTTILDPDYRDVVLKALDTAASGAALSAPEEIRLKGHNRIVPVRMFARKFGITDTRSVVLHFIDLTQEKTLEAQFVQSQKMQAIGQLAGGVAHDFNNLLTAMIGFCDLLLLRHKPGDPSFADINQIKQNGNRAANLVRQLLAFSRQQTLRPKVHDITDILIEVSHLLRRLIGASIELTLNHGTDMGSVKVDEGQMEQVLINLAVNARDAMPAGGKLMIDTFSYQNEGPISLIGGEVMPAGQWVAIKVSDTGHGMPADVMTRIFEPFFTTKDVGQGTGLGLSTVYGIMRQTGGYVQVESVLNKGTSFILYLPRVSDEEVAKAQDSRTEIADVPTDLTGTARILLVEDEDAVRTFSTRALTNKGYEVLGAEHGEAAMKLFNELQGRPIDLLVTDVVMPGMDGPTVAKAIREKMPNLKIIFVSGYTEEKLKDYMGPGIHFLPKPFTLKQLAEKVKTVLEE